VYIVSITQHNVAMPAGPSETNVFEQHRTQFTHKWKSMVSRRILQTGLRNLAKFFAENCGL